MTAVEFQIDWYFSSISSVAKKITQDCDNYRQKYGEDWNNLSLQQQNHLIDNFIIDPKVAEKYTPLDEEDLPVCFPKYRVNCGEKIVVDFDHDDGWTWQDEHSGPFSWKTKSQQDLTIDDIDELANEPTEGTKRHKMMRKSRSPERVDPSVNQSDTNEVEQIFQKFGIQFHNKDDESNDEAENSDKAESHENLDEVAASLARTEEFQRQSFVFEEQEEQQAQSVSSVSFSREGSVSHSEFSFDDYGHHGRETLDRTQSSSERSSSTRSSNSSKSRKKANGKPKDKVKAVKSRPESEQSLLYDISISVDKSKRDPDDIGQVSPVFIEDQGETSTDAITTYKFPYPQQADTSVSSSYEYDTTTVSSHHSRNEVHVEEEFTSTTKSEESGDGTKSGFDFLDNW